MKLVLAFILVASVMALAVAEHPLDFVVGKLRDIQTGAPANLQQPRFIRAGGICADRVFRWPCPSYEYLSFAGIEVRHYNGPLDIVFASVYGPPGNLFEGADFTFRAVERYFNGSNRENRRFENTVPFQLLVRVLSITEWQYTAIFFLPNGTALPPPAPLEAYVRIGQFPTGFDLAVEQFAPTPLFEEGPENAERVIFGAAHGLEDLLYELEAPYFPNFFVFNEYNIPFIHQNRRNEVSFEVARRPPAAGAAAAESEYEKIFSQTDFPVEKRHRLNK